MNARYWPCLGVKVFAGGLTPAIRFSCSSVPRTKEARMNVRYRVQLSHTERTELRALLSGGKQAARKLKRAQILLAADAGASDEAIATSVGVGGSTVYRTKRRFVFPTSSPCVTATMSSRRAPATRRALILSAMVRPVEIMSSTIRHGLPDTSPAMWVTSVAISPSW